MTDTRVQCEAKEILAELDNLQDIYLQCRSVFPTIDMGHVGYRHITTAPYYMRRGYVATMELKNPITSKFIERNRCIGKWVNENAIIRLYGILEHHGFMKKINHTLPGAKEVDLVRRMRNAFTKTSLNYRPKKQRNLILRNEVINHFRLDESNFTQGEIPTPINTVIEPSFDACREYIKAKCRTHNQSLAR